MGWTGRAYYGTTRKERLEKMLEVYNWEDETRKVETIDSALIGTTAYAAIRRTEKATGETSITAAVILSHMGGKNELVTKEMGESMGPGEYDCPKRILDKLTATESEWANEWRRKCRERLASKAPNHNVIPRMFIKIVGELLTIFWANNITDFAPETEAQVTVNGTQANLLGTWFNHHLEFVKKGKLSEIFFELLKSISLKFNFDESKYSNLLPLNTVIFFIEFKFVFLFNINSIFEISL